MSDHSKLSTNLEYLLKIYALSLNELAKKTQVPQPTLYRMLMGTTNSPRGRSLKQVADFFDLSVAQLTGIEPLPLKIPISLKDQLHVQEIPIIPLEMIKKWPFDIHSSEYAFKKILLNQSVDKRFFAIRNDNLIEHLLFSKETLFIFNPSIKPLHRNFILVYFSNTDKIELNRCFIEDNQYYFKKELDDGNISLIKINPITDKIIAVLVESRTTFID